MRRATLTSILFAATLVPLQAQEMDAVDLSGDKIITSHALGYKLQYRVFLPPSYDDLDDLPVLYVVDGQWYIELGGLHEVLHDLVLRDEVRPAIAVFVDNRNPENLQQNRRNSQFFCNPSYLRFFQEELIPQIEAEYRTSKAGRDRAILGLSFGGLNAACFGLLAPQTFGGIGIQSPALHPVPGIYRQFSDASELPERVFLSVGTGGDNVAQARALRNVLAGKEVSLEYIEVPQGHDWSNWKPLLDDALRFLLVKDRPAETR